VVVYQFPLPFHLVHIKSMLLKKLIDDEKLTGFGDNICRIYADDNLRLDKQGVSDPSYTTE
jgi:hypothetical protein